MSRSFASASSQYLELGWQYISYWPATIACWGRVTDATVNHCAVFVGDKNVDNKRIMLMFNGVAAGDPINLFVADSSGGSSCRTTSGFSVDTWHHLCGVVASNTDRRSFIDGGSKGTSVTSQALLGFNRVSIGRAGDLSPDQYVDGEIAEVAIWNAALTDAEVAILAAGYSPMFVRPTKLDHYIPLVRDNDNDLCEPPSFTAYNSPTIATHPRIIYPAPKFYSPPSVGQTVLDYERKHRGVFRGACRGAA